MNEILSNLAINICAVVICAGLFSIGLVLMILATGKLLMDLSGDNNDGPAG